ncbi:hypothetical protein M569_11160, partial [Genlisea aurea]
MDYQGMRNWEGLLDPLDENLRREIIRYGHFVEAAYRASEFRAASAPAYGGACRVSRRRLLEGSGFEGTGYKVTKNLIASSGISLPPWITDRVAASSSWIGYVAVCQNRREISRIGRRDVVIAFRGTGTAMEWVENLRATLAPVEVEPRAGGGPMVESGFLSLYTSSAGGGPSLQKLVRQEIGRILRKYGGEPLSFTFTGHSLGAALATLAAYDVRKTFPDSPLVTVISFAGPRVGDWRFRRHVERQGTKILRIVNPDDPVTKVPGFVVGSDDETSGLRCEAAAAAAENFSDWIRKLVEDTQWVYADIGCELKLRNRDSVKLNGFDLAACHDLKTYLQLVNGFDGSHCPFRSTARKLMN